MISLRSTFKPNALSTALCVLTGQVYSCGSNKGFGSRFTIYSRVRQESPEDGRRIYRQKCYNHNNKDKVNYPNNLSNNNYQGSSQKFRQIIPVHIFLVSQGQKTILSLKSISRVRKSLTCYKFYGFRPNLHHPFPVSSLCRIAFKITMDWIFVFFHFFFFSLV